MRILLVEDSAATRMVITRLLQHLKHAVTAVGDAETALAFDGPCDALLTDLCLPGMPGETLIAAFRARNPPPRHLIAMSASRSDVVGADVVLAKPVTRARLAAALAGEPPAHHARTGPRLDRGQLARLQQNIGRDRLHMLVSRFIAETDCICAQNNPDSMAMHHLAGAAALFGAVALQGAALAGHAQTEWPQTRAALLATLG